MRQLKQFTAFLINLLGLNYNEALHKENVVHKLTTYPIEEEKAIQTIHQSWMGENVIVSLADGRTLEFSKATWNDVGRDILKDLIITKIEW